MNPIEFGARQAVTTCLRVKKGENVVVITDLETQYLADEMITEAKKVGGVVRKFIMEDFGSRSADGDNPLPFPKEIADAISGTQVSIYIAQGKPGEFHSFRQPMYDLADKKMVRHAHMPNFTEIMMSMGMAADYSKIREITRRVHEIVSRAGKICVASPAGTDFVAEFDPKYRWVVGDGIIQPGHWHNLPDGEVYSVPVAANGRVVVDGCLGDFFNEKYGLLGENPLGYELKRGRCLKGSVECKNAKLKMEFEEYTFNTDENSNRVGELGIGTNIGVTKIIGNMLQDEKLPGVHVALGSPFPLATGAEWESKTHNDGILLNPTVVADGETIMKDGKFTIL